MAKVTFRPQAWQNDYAIEVDPEGPTTWQVPDKEVKNIKPHSLESDALREHKNAPQWVKDWGGPFECDFELDEPNPTKSADELIREIADCLAEASGDFIEKIANKTLSKRHKYVGDSMFEEV